MNFQVALMYDETENDNGQATEEALAAFDKAYKAYIGPQARYRSTTLNATTARLSLYFPSADTRIGTAFARQ